MTRCRVEQARAIWRKMSRSLLVLAVRAQPKHSLAFPRNSLADDTTQVPFASLCDPKYCQAQILPSSMSESSALFAAPELMIVASIRGRCARWCSSARRAFSRWPISRVTRAWTRYGATFAKQD